MTGIPGIAEPHATRILGIFGSLPPGSQVILFGSRAKGTFREGSDIDIALKGAGLTLEHRDALLRAYDDLFLPWKLDIVVYALAEEPALKDHIDRVGVPLLQR